MNDPQPELRVVRTDDPGRATLALISSARQNLAEARTLPDIKRVMEMAAVAKDAAQRAARMAEAERLVADVVASANEAANDAAAVRVEAQAKAGELLKDMGEAGTRAAGRPEKVSRPSTLSDLGVSRDESSLWQRVAAIPADERAAYVEETKAAQGEVSTAGLLRHARMRAGSAAEAGTGGESAADAEAAAGARRLRAELRRVLEALVTYPPGLLTEVADLELPRYVQLVRQADAWLQDARAGLQTLPWATRPPLYEGEQQEDGDRRWVGRGMGWVIDGQPASAQPGKPAPSMIGEWDRQRIAGRWAWRAEDLWQGDDHSHPYWLIEEPPEGRRNRAEAAAHRSWLEREHPDRAGDWELWYSAAGSWLCLSFHASLAEAQAAAGAVASDRDRMAELNAGRQFREPAGQVLPAAGVAVDSEEDTGGE